MRRPSIIALTVAILGTASFGQAQQAPPAATGGDAAAVPSTVVAPPKPLSADYVIGPGDVLTISVWKNEALSRTTPVRPDGKISLPLLYDVEAAGLTAMQLRDKLATALAEFIPNPEISVSVSEVRSMRVSVLGEVQRPGVLQLAGTTTVLEAIAMAGGFNAFASPSKITILRQIDNGKTDRIRFNYNKVLRGDSDEPNIVLKRGDVILVP